VNAQEREKGIQEIQIQINEVNEIFQDLAVLVNEQVRRLPFPTAPKGHVTSYNSS